MSGGAWWRSVVFRSTPARSTVGVRVPSQVAYRATPPRSDDHKDEAVEPPTKAIIVRKADVLLYRALRFFCTVSSFAGVLIWRLRTLVLGGGDAAGGPVSARLAAATTRRRFAGILTALCEAVRLHPVGIS